MWWFFFFNFLPWNFVNNKKREYHDQQNIPFNFNFSHFGQISHPKKFWGLLVTKNCCKNTKHLQNGPPMSFIKALSSFLSFSSHIFGENFHLLGATRKKFECEQCQGFIWKTNCTKVARIWGIFIFL